MVAMLAISTHITEMYVLNTTVKLNVIGETKLSYDSLMDKFLWLCANNSMF